MAVIDSNESGIRARFNLAAILEGLIRLDDGDRELPEGMRVEVSWPEEWVILIILAHTGVPLDRAHAGRCKVSQPWKHPSFPNDQNPRKIDPTQTPPPRKQATPNTQTLSSLCLYEEKDSAFNLSLSLAISQTGGGSETRLNKIGFWCE